MGKINPDIPHSCHYRWRNVEIFIDTSGEALFKRGYRQDTGEAPLRENLAAGLLLWRGYDGTQPFQDPFCGSGTIAIEAAWIATHRAPGLMRRFGFEKTTKLRQRKWQTLRREAEKQTKPAPALISGSDESDRYMIRAAWPNAQAAEVDNFIRF